MLPIVAAAAAAALAHVSFKMRPQVCRKKPKHSKAQSTMPTYRDVRDKP